MPHALSSVRPRNGNARCAAAPAAWTEKLWGQEWQCCSHVPDRGQKSCVSVRSARCKFLARGVIAFVRPERSIGDKRSKCEVNRVIGSNLGGKTRMLGRCRRRDKARRAQKEPQSPIGCLCNCSAFGFAGIEDARPFIGPAKPASGTVTIAKRR